MPIQPISSSNTPRWHIVLILLVGVVCVSTAAIFIRLALEAVGQPNIGFSLMLAASRLVLAAMLLTPAWRNFQPTRYPRGAIFLSGMAGLLLAMHFATWIISLSHISIAASTILVTTNPIWVALLSWLWFRETLSLRTLAGIAITLAGGGIIGLLGDGGSIAPDQNALLGNALALLGAWTFSLYFLLGREAQRRGLKIGQHVAIAYTSAALVLIPLPLIFGSSYQGYPPIVYGCIVMMAIVAQLIGHTSLNWAVQQISPTLVTLAILLEPVSASLLGYFIFDEVPGMNVLLGAAFILMGVAIAVTDARP